MLLGSASPACKRLLCLLCLLAVALTVAYREPTREDFDERQQQFCLDHPEDVSINCPIYVVVPLPADDHIHEGKNPFRLSIPKVRPVIDLAEEHVYRLNLLPHKSLAIDYFDEKCSDAIGPLIAVEQYRKNRLDCIMGYAFVYAMAPIARMSGYWRKGIPLITPVGTTFNLDDKNEYPLMTRITTPHKLQSMTLLSIFNYFSWKRHTFLFHNAKDRPGVPMSECFLLMSSIKNVLKELFPAIHNYFNFDESHIDRDIIREMLRQSSFIGNG